MIIFVVIAMMVIGFIWKNITVYDYNQTSAGPRYYPQHWGLDMTSGRRLPLTPMRIIENSPKLTKMMQSISEFLNKELI